MADVQKIVYERWNEVIESPLGVPLYTALAATGLAPPYAVAEFAETVSPIGAKAFMTECDVRITVYDQDERRIERVFESAGFRSIVPTGFHRCEIGDASTKATSRIAQAGLPRAEPEPPLGGGKCFSRVLTLAVRTGTKRTES